ncbi:prokaryotic phospholipase A2-domain-containing protein, partial [Massariosphaeria phaeospora]
TLEEYTDELLFSLNTEDFVSRRQNITDKPSGYHLIFESNSCGDAPNDPLSFNFKIACDRLSFGIRNYRAQNRLTPKNINAINEQFLVDMESACDAK